MRRILKLLSPAVVLVIASLLIPSSGASQSTILTILEQQKLKAFTKGFSLTGTGTPRVDAGTWSVGTPKVESYTFAGLPPAGTPGRLALVTDNKRNVVVDGGSNWGFVYPVISAEMQAGADAGARIQAAIDSLPSTGGTVDARGLEGAQTSAGNITLGSATKPVTLILGAITLTLTPPSQILYHNNSQILGIGDQSRIQGNHTTALIAPATAGAKSHPIIRNIYVDNTSSANAGGIGILWRDAQWGVLDDVRVENVETGIKLHPGTASTLYNRILSPRIRFTVTGIEVGDIGGGASNANQIIGGQISNTTDGIRVRAQSTKIFGTAVEVFTGVGVDITSVASDTMVLGMHFENTAPGTSIGIRTAVGTLRTTIGGNLYINTNNSVVNFAEAAQLRNLDFQPGVGTYQAESFGLNASTGARFAHVKSSADGVAQITNSTDTALATIAVEAISGTGIRARNLRGSATFAAGTTVAVTFGTPEPDASYFIAISANANKTFWVTAKTTTGFTLNASAVSSDTVDWVLIR
jgi:hypothetical protein